MVKYEIHHVKIKDDDELCENHTVASGSTVEECLTQFIVVVNGLTEVDEGRFYELMRLES